MRAFAVASVAIGVLFAHPAAAADDAGAGQAPSPQVSPSQVSPPQGSPPQSAPPQAASPQLPSPQAAPTLAIAPIVKAAHTINDCVGDNRFIYHAGTPILRTTTFLPAGNNADFIVQAEFKPQATYYVKFETPYLRRPAARTRSPSRRSPRTAPM